MNIGNDVKETPRHFFAHASNDLYVAVFADENAFPAGTTMNVSPVSKDTAIQAARSVVKDKIVDAKAVDIHFSNCNGEEIQPAAGKKVRVVLISGNDIGGLEHDIVHIEKSGVKKIAAAQASGASFYADTFSIYAIIGQLGGKATVTYEFYNDASNPALIATRIVKDGETIVPPGTPISVINPSNIFCGWSTAASPDDYQTFGTVSIPSTVNEDITVKLYARFGMNYHVFFHNQYDAIIQSFTVKLGESFHIADYNAYVTFPIPVGQALINWSTLKGTSATEPGLGEESGAVEDLTISGDVNLYPVLKSVHWISYVSNGGSFTPSEFVRYDLGATTEQPSPSPTRAGYTFGGWYDNSSLNEPAFVFGHTLSTDITLFARWIPRTDIPYRVAYWLENADDSAYSLKEVNSLTGTVDTLTAAPSDPLSGALDANLWVLSGSIVQANINGDGSTLVNVFYNRVIKTINFYTAANVLIPELTITDKWGAFIADLWPSLRYPDTYESNWHVGSVYQASISTMPTDSITSFTQVSYTGGVIYKVYHYEELLNGQTSSITYGGKYFGEDSVTDWWWSGGLTWSSTPEDHYSLLGYTYMDNVTYTSGTAAIPVSVNDPTCAYSLSFYYSRNSYNVNFFSGGTLINQIPKQLEADISDANYIPDSSEATTPGYVFAGWYSTIDYVGDPVTLSGTMPAHDITLYAKWIPPQYTVRFDPNGGTPATMTDQTDMFNKLVSRPEPPTRDGYVFSGWTLNGKAFNFNTTYISGSVLDYAVDGIITLRAEWIGGSIFRVVYDAMEGTNAPIDTNTYYSSANAVVKRASTPPSIDMFFVYWALSGKNYYPNSIVTLMTAYAVDGVVTLQALYGREPSPVYLTYYPNGGVGKDYTTQSVLNNQKITILNYNDTLLNYTRNGFTFVGWNTKADGSGVSYTAGTTVRIDNIGGNRLYAQWVPKTGEDITQIYLFAGIALLSMIAGAWLLLDLRRNKSRKKSV